MTSYLTISNKVNNQIEFLHFSEFLTYCFRFIVSILRTKLIKEIWLYRDIKTQHKIICRYGYIRLWICYYFLQSWDKNNVKVWKEPTKCITKLRKPTTRAYKILTCCQLARLFGLYIFPQEVFLVIGKLGNALLKFLIKIDLVVGSTLGKLGW